MRVLYMCFKPRGFYIAAASGLAWAEPLTPEPWDWIRADVVTRLIPTDGRRYRGNGSVLSISIPGELLKAIPIYHRRPIHFVTSTQFNPKPKRHQQTAILLK